jgi:hypothetical protein
MAIHGIAGPSSCRVVRLFYGIAAKVFWKLQNGHCQGNLPSPRTRSHGLQAALRPLKKCNIKKITAITNNR